MKKILVKPYIFVGTFVTVGIIITTVYTIVHFNNSKELDISSKQEERSQEEQQQINYSNEIAEVKNQEEVVEILKEKDAWKENNSKIKTEDITEVEEKTIIKDNTSNNVELENGNTNQEQEKLELLKYYLMKEKEIEARIQALKCATPMFRMEEARIKIEELEQKMYSTTKENEKEVYRNSIEKIKQQMEEQERYIERLEELESQLEEIKNKIEEIEK